MAINQQQVRNKQSAGSRNRSSGKKRRPLTPEQKRAILAKRRAAAKRKAAAQRSASASSSTGLAHAASHENDNEFLRVFFDGFYRFLGWLFGIRWKRNFERVVEAVRDVDPRVKKIVAVELVILFLLVVGTSVVMKGLEYAEWLSRPPLKERIAAPFGMAERALPNLDIDNYYLLPLTVETYAQAPELRVNHLLGKCLMETPDNVFAQCDRVTEAYYIESSVYMVGMTPELAAVVTPEATPEEEATPDDALEAAVPLAENPDVVAEATPEVNSEFKKDDGVEVNPISFGKIIGIPDEQVPVVVALYDDEELARQAFDEMYRYSRSIGRIGNFLLLPDEPVNYYYSTTRNTFSMTWVHGPLVYSVAARNYETLKDFVAQFPY